MTTIYLSKEHYTTHIEAVRNLARHNELHNPDFSGADIKVECDDSTWVNDSDGIRGAQLFASILHIVQYEDYGYSEESLQEVEQP